MTSYEKTPSFVRRVVTVHGREIPEVDLSLEKSSARAEESSSLFMTRIQIRTESVFNRSMALRISPWTCTREETGADFGYLLHLYLTSLFGLAAPKPFRVDVTFSRKGVEASFCRVLGYTKIDHVQLKMDAQQFADPLVWEGVDWSTFSSKPMPAFEVGQRVGFSTQVCPVIRRARGGTHGDRPGAEVDKFLAECKRAPGVMINREEVYQDWLDEQFSNPHKRGDEPREDGPSGAKIKNSSMTAFRLDRLLRRTHAKVRERKILVRPVAAMQGILEVIDPRAFQALLTRGLGRHRAFGFGMILLSRAP